MRRRKKIRLKKARKVLLVLEFLEVIEASFILGVIIFLCTVIELSYMLNIMYFMFVITCIFLYSSLTGILKYYKNSDSILV